MLPLFEIYQLFRSGRVIVGSAEGANDDVGTNDGFGDGASDTVGTNDGFVDGASDAVGDDDGFVDGTSNPLALGQ